MITTDHADEKSTRPHDAEYGLIEKCRDAFVEHMTYQWQTKAESYFARQQFLFRMGLIKSLKEKQC